MFLGVHNVSLWETDSYRYGYINTCEFSSHFAHKTRTYRCNQACRFFLTDFEELKFVIPFEQKTGTRASKVELSDKQLER